MTTLEHRDFREKNGFPDITVPTELFLKYAMGGEIFGSSLEKIIGEPVADVEVFIHLHRPGLHWVISIHEKGYGGCCLLERRTDCKTVDEAAVELAKECKRIFKKSIKIELEKLQFSLED